MGAHGPKGKPAAVKELEGNPGKRPLPVAYVMPAGPLERPDYVHGYAAEVWERITASMPAGVYTPTDAGLLAAYCIAESDLRDAVFHLLIEGQVVDTQMGPKRNPWGVVATQARQQLATLGTRLGLDPMARENIKAPDKRPVASAFAGLVGIDGGKR